MWCNRRVGLSILHVAPFVRELREEGRCLDLLTFAHRGQRRVTLQVVDLAMPECCLMDVCLLQPWSAPWRAGQLAAVLC